MTTLPDKPYLRVDEVAALLDVSRSTVYLWIEHGHLDAVKIVGVIRIPRDSVDRLRLGQGE